MRTVLFVNKFFYRKGGSESVLFQERDMLLNEGFRVVDFSMADERNMPSPYASHFVPQIDYHDANVGKLQKMKNALTLIHSTEAVKRIRRLAEETRPDIAHFHNIYHQLTPSIIPQLKKGGAKTLLTLHDFKLVCPAYTMLNGSDVCDACQGKAFRHALTSGCQATAMRGLLLMAEAYFHAWMKSYDAVDCFIAPSAFMAELVGRHRVPPEKIAVLRNGIDPSVYVPSGNDAGYALYFGRLSREKGVKTLIDAHSGLRAPMPLRVVGAGPLEDELRGTRSEAEFLGYKSGNELRELVNNASFVIVPSEWYENCSMVVLEAMALGKPIIGARIGGIPEQVEDGETGLLFESGNARELAERMERLWADPALRRRLGANARAKLEREYSLGMHCNELLRIYEQLLAG